MNYTYPRHWRVSITTFVPVPGSRPPMALRQKTQCIGVLACSIERAIEAVREKHPDCRLERVEPGDPIELIADHPDAVEVAERLRT